jgi:hypothetical protein
MEEYYLQVIENVNYIITREPSERLLTEEFFEQRCERSKINVPSLDKENIGRKVDSEIMTFDNAPEGLPISLGDYMDYVLFEIPIKGNTSLFQTYLKGYIAGNSKTMRVDNDKLFLKEFSRQPLNAADNNSAIDKIKEAAKQKINLIENSLAVLSRDVEDFNNNRLSVEIRELINAEHSKRTHKAETLDKLKLF